MNLVYTLCSLVLIFRIYFSFPDIDMFRIGLTQDYVLIVFVNAIDTFKDLCNWIGDVILLMQAYEWVCMISLIKM